MDVEFEVFDYKRIFFGDTPILFLAEIVFRTVIMYTYTVFLIRVLGKRGMGQLSGLELAWTQVAACPKCDHETWLNNTICNLPSTK